MERRYLIATLALIATFAVFSRGLRSLEAYSKTPSHQAGMKMGAQCPTESSAFSRWLAKARTHLRPAYPEEAQLLTEMNLPFANMQARAAEQIAQQNLAAAQCARETAMREAERAQIQQKMAREQASLQMDPISYPFTMPPALRQRIEVKTSAVAAKVAARAVKVQMTADVLPTSAINWADSGVENVVFAMDTPPVPPVAVHVNVQSPCKPQAVQTQTRRALRDSRSNIVRSGEYAF